MSYPRRIGMLFVAVSLITACSTSKNDLLPTSDSTMRDIWHKATGNNAQFQTYRNNARSLEAPRYIPAGEQQSYSRTAENEITNLFPRLPNPDLIMYVYPHLSESGEPMPIPGYTSVIPFYGRVQYAQPSERTRGL
ncbi:TIGR03751 family conjugal transfer lipoprotein [Aggregatibacter actinomycetemcomitans]|uniref:TIGR03751 family conjugal transfer lipoprotein n=1 Tax=Aggregatibacter actinomycetemcomitans TaxID=714 RepID=UPI00022AD57A|nr:TIGR03751 family conjugal transfer lipoprotein [Aggregatibacter actinomycetemcomitans]KOE64193.1 conjugal transfer protein [Aggregatibacter actinomycetemcomitans serotype e str. A160]KOE67041.1 conjugal transfer protein [Aggregatibacter actinomycetemcomitans serotype e str. SCC393]KYK72987.1 conjugal transfer protein [Aggregatibacter actinomycetemcomitans serotype e str. SA2876]